MIEAPRELSERTGFPVEIPDKCRQCITLARFASRYDELCRGIQNIEQAGLSGALTEQWVSKVAEVGNMTSAEAEEFVSAREQQLRDDLVARLAELDKERDQQTMFARFIIDHCESGVVKLASITPDVVMEAEACGSKKPELVRGPKGSEILRVSRDV